MTTAEDDSNQKRTTLRSRTSKQVFHNRLDKRKKGLVEEAPELRRDYRGHRILKEFFAEAEFYNILCNGELAFLERRGFSDQCEVKEGLTHFLIRGGRIIA